MSEAAFKLFDETFREQQSRYQARRIRTRVAEARRSIPSAGLRWPFELFQNALDSGPRAGNSSVAIRLSCEQTKIAFEHDGIPFTSSDLTALLSGGSNKDFESEETTGRFGTGFLVTHVLAERTSLRGLLETPNGSERFDLLLDRGGDEEAILENMAACREAIRSASPVSDLDGVESARFEYHIDDDNPLTLGIESLRSALPYLYATRQVLGRVELWDREDDKEVWTPTEVTAQALEGGYVEERSLQVHQNGTDWPEVRVFRFMTSEQGSASALVLVERTSDGWRVVPPAPNACRVYREYPLSGSGFLPTNFILDGKFEPDQERNRLLMGDEDKSLLEEALAAAVVAVQYAFASKWEGAHLLAQAQAPARGFDTANIAERDETELGAGVCAFTLFGCLRGQVIKSAQDQPALMLCAIRLTYGRLLIAVSPAGLIWEMWANTPSPVSGKELISLRRRRHLRGDSIPQISRKGTGGTGNSRHLRGELPNCL